jgi:cell division protein FtsZ
MNKPVENPLQTVPLETATKELSGIGPRLIAVVGVGDAGNVIINHLRKSHATGVKYIAIDTDIQRLEATHAAQRILIERTAERGLGSDEALKTGKSATMAECRKQVEEALSNVDVVFVATALGGHTETVAASLVAEIARVEGSIVIGVAIKPSNLENGRINRAALGVAEMQAQYDTIVVIDDDTLRRLAPDLPLDEAFEFACQVSANTLGGIIDTMLEPGLIELDFARFREIVKRGGLAVVGIGESDAPDRAKRAVRKALGSPILDADCSGAGGALVHISGDDKMTLEEANRVGEMVTEMMHENALVSWGARVNPSLPGILRVTLVMTGVHSPRLLGGFDASLLSLYDMDPQDEHEKPLQVDLDLHQLENFK